jgi:hypothetical protein
LLVWTYVAPAVDSDGDGIVDSQDPHPLNENTDVDGDGLTDQEELERGTNPDNPDTDGDGLKDGEEIKYHTDPLNADTDADGLKDGEEVRRKLDPTKEDTDGDGLSDYEELKGWDCYVVKSLNNEQIIHMFSDPLKEDSDGDGIGDREERNNCWPVINNYDDRDGLPDSQDPWPFSEDGDKDGIKDKDELDAGLNPYNPDTDGDGIPDGSDEENDGYVNSKTLRHVKVPHHGVFTMNVENCTSFLTPKCPCPSVCRVDLNEDQTTKEITLSLESSKGMKVEKQYSNGEKETMPLDVVYKVKVSSTNTLCSANYEIENLDKTHFKIKFTNTTQLANSMSALLLNSCRFQVVVSAYHRENGNSMWLESKTFYVDFRMKYTPTIEAIKVMWPKIGNDYYNRGTVYVRTKYCKTLELSSNGYFENGKKTMKITIPKQQYSLFSMNFYLYPQPKPSFEKSSNLEILENEVKEKIKSKAKEKLESSEKGKKISKAVEVLEFASDLKEKGERIGEAAAKITYYKSKGAKIIYGLLIMADTVEATIGGLSIVKETSEELTDKMSGGVVDEITEKIKQYTLDAAKEYLRKKAEQLEKKARRGEVIYNVIAKCCADRECTKASAKEKGLGFLGD